ncbi:hypothetical protein [Oscillatoria sp. FACHB-1406]|uniref:hypothetical protein n=1 Tax=Oscillatoria sp. FACHB-1406 TaxID=2692846 RepID=UPI0016847E76|nr:hypothetical protein [Oscillatoria sp. FACHB-1406]MBD2580299.1 hypothetical protein [Oscillatoria sp. FACHB-1406]
MKRILLGGLVGAALGAAVQLGTINCPKIPLLELGCVAWKAPGAIASGATTGFIYGAVAVAGLGLLRRKYGHSDEFDWRILTWGSIGALGLFSLYPPTLNATQGLADRATQRVKETIFLGSVSQDLIRRAIGHAEGNLTVSGELTSLYYGHTDPGNGVRNFGYCSNQNRTSGVNGADESCDRYIGQFKPRAAKELLLAGIDLKDKEALLNTLDLANQANPRTFPRFPHKLSEAREKGLQGIEAITYARVQSFGTGGREATGLIGICRRENRPVTDEECVAYDQRRRAKAIRKVLERELGNNAANAEIPSSGS